MTSPDDPGSTKPHHVAVGATPPGRPTAYLIVLQGATAGQVVKLDRPSCVIGRADRADLRLPDLGISGTHAVVRVASDGQVSIQDLHSTNGTRVNDERVDGTQKLDDGDKISMGATTILKFTYDDTLTMALAAQLAGQGKLDGLTGAYREQHFRERLGEDFAYSIRHQTPLAVAVISIDYFEQLRSEHGPDCADKILAEFGRRARALLADHLFGRLGRRTFGALYRDLTLDEACAITEKIRIALAGSPVDVGDLHLAVTMSAGVSALPFPGIESASVFLRMADIGLMDAKQTHNCVTSRNANSDP